MTQKYSTICLREDFNSRTKHLDDNIVLDTDFFEMQNLHKICDEYNSEMGKFENASNIDKVRQNNDRFDID